MRIILSNKIPEKAGSPSCLQRLLPAQSQQGQTLMHNSFCACCLCILPGTWWLDEMHKCYWYVSRPSDFEAYPDFPPFCLSAVVTRAKSMVVS